jgi:thioredoxin-like negative regulator of GroEL
MTAAASAAIATAGHGQPDTKPKLLFFYSTRCGKARRVEGFLAQVLQRRHNHDAFTIVRVNIDTRPDLAQRFNVPATPALLVVQDRQVRVQVSQPTGCVEITDALRPWLH